MTKFNVQVTTPSRKYLARSHINPTRPIAVEQCAAIELAFELNAIGRASSFPIFREKSYAAVPAVA
jgi:hypothetical protein